jgi:hypothetical protein
VAATIYGFLYLKKSRKELAIDDSEMAESETDKDPKSVQASSENKLEELGGQSSISQFNGEGRV